MSEPHAQPPQKPRGLLTIMLILFGTMMLVVMMFRNLQPDEVPWSRFLANVDEGKVTRIEQGSDYIVVTPTKDAGAQPYRVLYPGSRITDNLQSQLEKSINSYNAKVDAGGPEAAGKPKIELNGAQPAGVWAQMLPSLLFFAIFVAVLYFVFFRRMSQGGGVLSFGKSRAQLVAKGKTGKTFKDVAGIDEAKDEVEELVAFLKNPKKFQKLGGRIPRGVLLIGSPGTGKTLLAKAIAGEADVPFYSISGSDFVEMFVGVGASRVRDLFTQAKDNSPCIIFIDEIDAVGRRRGQGISSGGHDEREQTLNAILVEMDGFGSGDKVIVIAATNRVDVLDPALLRPGRFDRHINVSLPDITGREQILKVHCGKVKVDPAVDLSLVARGTSGFSGADLESLINEAALNAARCDQEVILQKDFEYARDRVAFGQEKKTGSRAMPEREREITAYHEAGHALLQLLVDEADDLHKVTIIPRGRALGATMMLPTEDRHTHGKKKILSDICVLFGGRLAEELFCNDITTGASNDIQRATQLARGMVYEWGMSDRMGPIKYTEEHDSMMGSESVVVASGTTRRELDEEVRVIIDSAYTRARTLIESHREVLEKIARALLEHETLDGGQVKHLLGGGNIAPRKPTVSISKDDAEAIREAASRPAPTVPSDALQPKLA
jgi:cell division protease FtsH